jgi:hypothetical protein
MTTVVAPPVPGAWPGRGDDAPEVGGKAANLGEPPHRAPKSCGEERCEYVT